MEIVAAIAGAAAGVAMEKIANAFGDAKLEPEQKKKIEEAVKRKVFGGNPRLRRNPDEYAQSPLIKHIKQYCKLPSTIYVAYVPNNNGKTTACYACMDKPYTQRGIAFSPEPSMQDMTYFDFMVQSLGFDSANPPRGFMTQILNALSEGTPDPELLHNVIILDNFMTEGFNAEECSILHKLKGRIKETGVTALILTPNRDAACRLIAQNSLGVIVPLVSHTQITALRCANPTVDPGKPLQLDWDKELSMVWDKTQLMKAVEHSIYFGKLDGAKQDMIRQRFSDVYSNFSQDQRDAADPVSMAAILFSDLKPDVTTPPKNTTPTNSGCGLDLCFFRV